MHDSLEKTWTRRFSSTSAQGAHNVSLSNDPTLKIWLKINRIRSWNTLTRIISIKLMKERKEGTAGWKRNKQLRRKEIYW